MKNLFLAWQNIATRRWFPIGQLQQKEGVFQFRYLNGVKTALSVGDFMPLPEFPDLTATYESEELFPLFANRVMPASRPDFAEYISWLRLEGREKDPLAFLAQTNGRRQTDTLEIFPAAEPLPDGGYRTTFFVHGLRHMSPGASTRAENLEEGERLRLYWDAQNPVDSGAIGLRTHAKASGDVMSVGYCPRYLSEAILEALRCSVEGVIATVIAVNLSPVPTQYRILCELRFQPGSTLPFAGQEFQPTT